MKKNDGFTIIELLVMITLLLIILALVVPNLLTFINNSDRARYETIKSNIEASAEMYVERRGGFARVGTSINLDNLDLDQSVRADLANFAEGGLAGEGVTTYEGYVCVDNVNSRVVYHISGYRDIGRGDCREAE